MALILNIETTTDVCSVCLAKDGKIVVCEESARPNAHSSSLSPFIDALFKKNAYSIQDIEAVSVSKGPGSYTGLRIGVSMAKGIAYSLAVPLIAISTLEHMTAGAIRLAPDPKALYCPLIDARRMEVYTALFDIKINHVASPAPTIINEDFLYEHLSQVNVYFYGSGLNKAKGILEKRGNSRFLDQFQISSRDMCALSEGKFQETSFEDLAYFSPMYLKEFVPFRNKMR